MKKERLLSLFLIPVLLAALLLPIRAADGYEADAKAALLIEVGTGEVLYEKNSHARNYPASITKVMTALLVFEAIDAGRLRLDQEITAGDEATKLPSGASTAGIKVGETLTVEDLLYCLLIQSANEAGNILAEAIDGSVEAFVARMNRRAQELGCEDTHFMNPHGLHDDDHYTTAWDIYLITTAALEYELFDEISNTKSYTVPETNLSRARDLHTTNYLISTWRTRSYYYPDAIGIKTGSTPEAGYCLVSSAERGGRRLLSVVLGAERITGEDGVIYTKSFSETSRLFEHGFNDFQSLTLLSDDEFICEVPVELSSEANYVVVHPSESVTRMVDAGLDAEDFTRTVTLTAESVDAPVAEGDELGTITVSRDGTVYAEVPLLALNDVSASKLLIRQRQLREFVATTRFKLIVAGAAALVVGLVVLRVALASRARQYGKRRSGGYSYTGYRGRKKR